MTSPQPLRHRCLAAHHATVTGAITSWQGTILFNHNPSLIFYAPPGSPYFHHLFVDPLPAGTDRNERVVTVAADAGSERFFIHFENNTFHKLVWRGEEKFWRALDRAQIDEIRAQVENHKIILLSRPTDHCVIDAVKIAPDCPGIKGYVFNTGAIESRGARPHNHAKSFWVPGDGSSPAREIVWASRKTTKPHYRSVDPRKPICTTTLISRDGRLRLDHRQMHDARDEIVINGQPAVSLKNEEIRPLVERGLIPTVPPQPTRIPTPYPAFAG